MVWLIITLIDMMLSENIKMKIRLQRLVHTGMGGWMDGLRLDWWVNGLIKLLGNEGFKKMS